MAKGVVIEVRNGVPVGHCAGEMVQGVNGVHHWWENHIDAISPGTIVTPLAHDELHGERAAFYQEMLKKMPAGRAGTPDEVAALAALIMGPEGGFITGSDFLIDAGATANFFFGPIRADRDRFRSRAEVGHARTVAKGARLDFAKRGGCPPLNQETPTKSPASTFAIRHASSAPFL